LNAHSWLIRTLLAVVALAATPALAQKAFLDVGKQPPITVLIGSTPWYPAFEKVVGLYEDQTGTRSSWT
jgi:multiple sugar transport system substrate-binding protein